MTDELVTLEIEERGEIVIVRLAGELDIAGAQSIGEQIGDGVPTAAHGLVIDMSELDFIDSSGVAMLFSLARRLSSRRQRLRLVAPDGRPVKRVLEIVDFHRAAPVHDDLGAALDDL